MFSLSFSPFFSFFFLLAMRRISYFPGALAKSVAAAARAAPSALMGF
jgi:hypothetical protein